MQTDEEPPSDALWAAVRRLVADLADGRFAAIEADGRSGRLTAEALQRAVREYGRTLCPLPEDGRRLVDVYPIRGRPGEALVDVTLWTQEEGESDLTLKLAVAGEAVSVTDLRVM
ncbi:MAG: hypothetical protein EP330_27535 [Deltaproteobacteria bacterium]|nr:MAG: hypothetical protein EP330_27535 [Deltaproteobacteria bacterium]